MGDAIMIGVLLIAGLSLVIIEIIFVPGTTVVGIAGVISSIVGVYLSFSIYGDNIGYLVTTVAVILNTATLIWALRTRAWERFSLKSSINSKVNEGQQVGLKVGDTGTTISALRPIGKALFGEKEYEVTTGSSFLDSGKKIKIVRIKNSKIYIEPLTE
jgi:membrane-bound ClpP family serine protease